MTNNLWDLYFEWLLSKIKATDSNYRHLLMLMSRKDFHYILLMDANRYQDGISLRYQFGYECGIPDLEVEHYLDTDRECSVLEMMIALAIRTETDTMYNSMYGDRTYIWFWDMVRSLGLIGYTDENSWNTYMVDYILEQFMDHNYLEDGRGGLVTIDPPPADMRTVDIWTQINWKLNEYLAEYGG